MVAPLGLLAVFVLLLFLPSVVAKSLFLVNLAVTDFAAVISTLHLAAVPVQAPDQPVKVEFFTGVAVSVTRVPAA